MDDQVAPNIPDRYLGSNEEENRERERMFSSPQYQLIPIAKVRTKSDLQLRPADAEESFLNLVFSVTDQCDLEARTQDLLSHSDFYRYMGEINNPDTVEKIAKNDAARNTPRIQDINLRASVFQHEFVHQLKYFISSDQNLRNATSILYENTPHGTLERFVERLGFAQNREKIIFEFIYELASALKYCHIDLEVMHRAVNPKHIFVFEHNGLPYVKLGGLVFAKMPEESRGNTETRNPMRGYCAPETIADGTIVSCYEFSSDIYSLGMVAYFMSQGRHPHADCRRSMTEFKRELERELEPRRLTFDQVLSPLMMELVTKCTIIERRNRDGNISSLGLRPTANQVENYLEENGYKPVFN